MDCGVSRSPRSVLVPTATLAVIGLALAALGGWFGAAWRDPLDAAAFSSSTALVAALGLFAAGPLAADLPTGIVNAALAANPIVALGISGRRRPAQNRFALPDLAAGAPALRVSDVVSPVGPVWGGPPRVRCRNGPLTAKRKAMNRSSMFVAASLSLVLFAPLSAGQQAAAGGSGALSAATRQELMKSLASGAAFLRSQQSAEGTFDANPGVSAVAAAALLRQPGVPRGMLMDAGGGKALDALAKLAKPDGGIYDKDIPHYITAVAVMALVAGGRPQDKPLIEKGAAVSRRSLLDEGEGVKPTDKFYGGMGYGGTSDGGRADIISLEYALRAMKEAELPANNAAWDKAIKFLQRTQNNSETNDQKWAANDGGFVYYPGFSYNAEGGTQVVRQRHLRRRHELRLGQREEGRSRACRRCSKWVRDNYTVDENPGHRPEDGLLLLHGVREGAAGRRRADHRRREGPQPQLARRSRRKKLISLQHPEGYWVNTDKAEMQDNKVLVTAFTMQAIEAALQP